MPPNPCTHKRQLAGAFCPQESDLPVKAYRAFDLSLPAFELPQLPSVQLPLPSVSVKVEVEVPPVQVRTGWWCLQNTPCERR